MAGLFFSCDLLNHLNALAHFFCRAYINRARQKVRFSSDDQLVRYEKKKSALKISIYQVFFLFLTINSN